MWSKHVCGRNFSNFYALILSWNSNKTVSDKLNDDHSLWEIIKIILESANKTYYRVTTSLDEFSCSHLKRDVWWKTEILSWNFECCTKRNARLIKVAVTGRMSRKLSIRIPLLERKQKLFKHLLLILFFFVPLHQIKPVARQ